MSKGFLKVKKIHLYIMICLAGIFITGTVLRNGFYGNTMLKQHSPLLYLGLILIALYIPGGNRDMYSRKYDKRLLSASIMGIVLSAVVIFLDGRLFSSVNAFISIIVPIAILAYRFRDQNIFVSASMLLSRFFQISMALMIFTEIIDLISGYAATHAIAVYSGVASLLRMYNQKRCVTYMGHALFSSELFLAGYIFVYLYKRMIGKKSSLVDILIPLIGISLTQSRAGLILLIVAYLVFNLEFKNALRIIGVLLIVLLVYQVGLFDAFLARVFNLVASGDFSAGRNSSISTLFASGSLRLFWLHGQSIEYNGAVTSLGMALEYPILCWAYSFGIFISVILTLFYAVIPLIYSIKDRNKEIFFAILILILDVMSYSGLGNNGDKPAIFAVFICMLLNYLNYYKGTSGVGR